MDYNLGVNGLSSDTLGAFGGNGSGIGSASGYGSAGGLASGYGSGGGSLMKALALGADLIMNIENENHNRYQIEKMNEEFNSLLRELNIDPADYYANYRSYEDPTDYTTYTLGDSEYNNITIDPETLAAQNKALEELINLSEAKGLNAIDQQALQEIVNEENRNLKAQNDAIAQEAMQRGVYGSGLEMAQRLQNAQSSANRMSNRDMDVMSQAQKRALDALSSYGNLSSNMRNQSYNEQAQRAKAQDAINEANWRNLQSTSNENVKNRNAVNQENVNIYNKNQDKNLESTNTLFNNRLKKGEFQYGGMKNNLEQKIDSNTRQMKNVDAGIEAFSSLF